MNYITCDFVTLLPLSKHQMDVVFVVVNRLTKLAHIILIRTTYPISTLARLYQDQIVKLHGVPQVIVLDRDPDSPLHSRDLSRKSLV